MSNVSQAGFTAKLYTWVGVRCVLFYSRPYQPCFPPGSCLHCQMHAVQCSWSSSEYLTHSTSSQHHTFSFLTITPYSKRGHPKTNRSLVIHNWRTAERQKVCYRMDTVEWRFICHIVDQQYPHCSSVISCTSNNHKKYHKYFRTAGVI